MSTLPENEKVALENHGNASAAPSLISDESLVNPTGINEKALLRKLDLKLLPPLTLLYLLSFLDRSNSMSSPLPSITITDIFKSAMPNSMA
jgi:hypothetical protein